ncbi:hypothetical protein P4N68_05855 [Corynebacterium felinum]|uniref:Uncharacterized protein n=1 Tax=Corynebacterium felinum TaxID=131318 RepID=A0ABU2B787_9CORY|nr:hypothetical protein [Corynebacterium felinum]MDF5820602.1 hypothetical protein [Corynebacterium felinum]MDR7354161.1 hypothetical protein [Corynebacterium felinum]WJY96333.1 hypothetical protein CFELI_13810 [Corynebacterium felinum]
MLAPPAFAQAQNMEDSHVVEFDMDDDDISFEDFDADFEFVAIALVPESELVEHSQFGLPPNVQLPKLPSSSIPHVGALGEALTKLASGSSNVKIPDALGNYHGYREVPVHCKGILDRPHQSFHKPKTINTQARVKFDRTMAEISGEVTLTTVGVGSISSGVRTVHDRRRWKHNVARSCDYVTRDYRSTVRIKWRAHAPGRPREGTLEYSEEASIACKTIFDP